MPWVIDVAYGFLVLNEVVDAVDVAQLNGIDIVTMLA